MSVLGIDLGGTKLAAALFDENGNILHREVKGLDGRTGSAVGNLITEQIKELQSVAESYSEKVLSIGISVPGINWSATGRVWAPNIPGWSDYPLLSEVMKAVEGTPVIIDSDRACYIMGETWKGNAAGCRDVVFISVGTGIGAGIMINGEILRGSHDIAGAAGWMALDTPYKETYAGIGCFEYHASGEGIAKVAREYVRNDNNYYGELRSIDIEAITSHEVVSAWRDGDVLASRVIGECVQYWGMAAANFVSLFNPEKIIFGGGIFGPLQDLVPLIKKEAEKWAQPLGIRQAAFDVTRLGGDAGIYGAGYMALKNLEKLKNSI